MTSLPALDSDDCMGRDYLSPLNGALGDDWLAAFEMPTEASLTWSMSSIVSSALPVT
jgi:hypothetical protein